MSKNKPIKRCYTATIFEIFILIAIKKLGNY